MSSFDALDVDHGGLLSDATLSALQLRQQPFTATAADGDAFSDDTTAEQLSDIKQALINGDDLLLILGEEGAGKSTLLSQLGANSGMRIQCFSVTGSQRFSTMNLFAGMLEAFKQKPESDLKSLLDQLIPCLQSMVAGNTLSAIVLDDAHQVSEPELTRLLSSMLYINSRDETLMRIALAAPSAFEDHIPDLLPEGADLPYSSLTIDQLDSDRANAYLDFRLNQAGYFEEFPFSDREFATVVEQSDGLPKGLHIAAANTLNERYGEYQESIPPELLAESSSLTSTKGGKLILGALAAVLIIGGLVLFRSPSNEVEDNRYSVVEERKIEANSNNLSLVNEGGEQSSDTTAGNDASLASDDSDASGDNEATNSATSSENQASDDNNTSTNNAGSDNDGTASGSADNDAAAESNSAAQNNASDATENSDQSTAGATDTDENTATENDDSAATDNNNDQESSSGGNAAGDASDTSDDSDSAATSPIALESPNWVLTQDSSLYTVQMSASTDREVVESFLTKNPLEGPNSIFSFDRDGTTWFALVHGLYPSIDAARVAIERLPPAALTNQPWIRAVGRIQQALKEQN